MVVHYPITGYRRSIYANRVSVEWVTEQAAVISFALVAKTGAVIDHERVVMSPEGLKRRKESVVSFLDTLGLDEGEVPPMPALPLIPSLGVADELLISTGSVTEIVFAAFSYSAASAEGQVQVHLEGVLRVQAPVTVVRRFIRLLYVHESPT